MHTADTGRRDFATRLYEKLANTHAGKNLFLSPFSIRVVLAMCSVGAKGETRRVMADLIGEQESVEDQNRHFAKLLKWIHGEGESFFQLVIANALWGQKGYHFKAAFRKDIADYYDGAFHEVDFSAQPDEAVGNDQSLGRTSDSREDKGANPARFLNDDSRLVITNAIYFKGPWEKAFDKADTRVEDWFGSERNQGSADDAPDWGGTCTTRTGGFQALDVAYKGRTTVHAGRIAEKDGRTCLARTRVGRRRCLPPGDGGVETKKK